MNIISAFPTNVEKGVPIAIIDGTRCTKLRTAAVGCVVAKYLAPSKVNTIGFIGASEEAKMYFVLLKPLFSTIFQSVEYHRDQAKARIALLRKCMK